MQAAFPEFFERFDDALDDAVRQLGGYKKIGPKLWPELSAEQAGNRLRDCLNADRREKLSPHQVLLLLKLARDAGHHGLMAWMAMDAGYEAPRPVEPEEQEAALQRDFVAAVDKLEQIQRQLQRTAVRRAA